MFDHSTHLTLAALPGMANRTIVTSSLSKTYGVTGGRCEGGWVDAVRCSVSFRDIQGLGFEDMLGVGLSSVSKM